MTFIDIFEYILDGHKFDSDRIIMTMDKIEDKILNTIDNLIK